MRTQEIRIEDQSAFCAFPEKREDLPKAISALGLGFDSPVMVLIGGYIRPEHFENTQQAITTIAQVAEELNALVVSGGTHLGIMAAFGQIRGQENYNFPLVGVAPANLSTWPGGPSMRQFLLWGPKRWQLASYYSHFILVPGGKFGDESIWIADIAALLSQGHKSVTILFNGGNVSHKDVQLSLDTGRVVLALAGTGRLADELASRSDRDPMIKIVSADNREALAAAIREELKIG